MPTAKIKMVVEVPPEKVVSSTVSVVETLADGTALDPAVYAFDFAANPAELTKSFTASFGSTLVGTQVYVNDKGQTGPPTVSAPFPVVDTTPPAPGALSFEVVGVQE